MPGLYRKLLVFAAVDGLFLQPAGGRTSDLYAGIRIDYGTTNKIINLSDKHDSASHDAWLEVHGIVGLLNLVSSSYLILITKRDQVAQIRQKAVYRISDVTLVPLSSQKEASNALHEAKALLRQDQGAEEKTEEEGGESDVGEQAETSTIGTEPDEQEFASAKKDPKSEEQALEPPKKSTTFVRDVVQKKGTFGKFTSSWFSRKGSAGQVAAKGVDADENEVTREQKNEVAQTLPYPEKRGEENEQDAEEPAGRTSAETKRQSAAEYLTPRILKTARLYFSSSGFFFSYEHNLSISPINKGSTGGYVPLWKQYDSLFFWNRHLARPFIEAGQDNVVLPLMQGFVGQRAFTIAETNGQEQDVVAEAEGTELTDLRAAPREATKHDVLVTLISRRSIKRAGLRYLRRGVDDQGNVANSVETEQILSTQDWSEHQKSFSLTQIRGSMPLFFSQSPYSFKPTPVMFGSEATTHAAFHKHFQTLAARYGGLYAASLIDKHGTEVAIGEAYEKHAKLLNEQGGVDGKVIGFEWFDFHGQCKGMRFENVSILLDTLNEFLTTSGYTVKLNGQTEREQSGVLRINCMDCLDRTNVTQSAIGGWSLQQQLAELGLQIDLKTDPKTQWFNALWADNGDAISKQYAGTSALKGDFTRTRKRNWAGALSDFGLTLNRYYNNIFGDYFLQTNIDYFLGASVSVFDDFETDMTSQDYRIDMSQVRQNAIDTCMKIALEDPREDLSSAWTMSCPRQSNTLRSLPFEECVLLLTDMALYFCRFDWDTEKLGSFERIDLLDIEEMWSGAYVTSALGPQHMDENRNYGFVIKYRNLGESLVRTNTRSLSVSVDGSQTAEANEGETTHDSKRKQQGVEVGEKRILAFKALPPQKSVEQSSESLDEMNSTKKITVEIAIAVEKAREQKQNGDSGKEKTLEVQERSIISAAEAKKTTSYVESLGYSMKKLIWS